jgi:hypothetical protein
MISVPVLEVYAQIIRYIARMGVVLKGAGIGLRVERHQEGSALAPEGKYLRRFAFPRRLKPRLFA